MTTPIFVAHMLISCGYMDELEATLCADGSLKISWSHLWPLVMPETLTNWTARDLLIASEYVEHRQDYSKAERGFRYVLYQRGCLPPRYPVPSTLGDVQITRLAVYLADPKGYDCVACWSKHTGTQTI